jgi:hypothetical protein
MNCISYVDKALTFNLVTMIYGRVQQIGENFCIHGQAMAFQPYIRETVTCPATLTISTLRIHSLWLVGADHSKSHF